MNVRVTKYSSSRSKLYAAGVFTLALLILVVSCPLKRMVQGAFITGASAQKFNRSSVYSSNQVAYPTTASCCALKNKEQVVASSAQELGVPSPSSLIPYLTVVQGFGIHYFLSRADRVVISLTPAASLTLPLFLQHLRLLI